jgi:hypothetical protein
MARKDKPPGGRGTLIRKLRKPIAPPSKVEEDERKYKRAREHEKLRRETEQK